MKSPFPHISFRLGTPAEPCLVGDLLEEHIFLMLFDRGAEQEGYRGCTDKAVISLGDHHFRLELTVYDADEEDIAIATNPPTHRLIKGGGMAELEGWVELEGRVVS